MWWGAALLAEALRHLWRSRTEHSDRLILRHQPGIEASPSRLGSNLTIRGTCE